MNALAIMLVSLCSKYSLLGSWHNLCQIIFFKYFFKVFFFFCVCVCSIFVVFCCVSTIFFESPNMLVHMSYVKQKAIMHHHLESCGLSHAHIFRLIYGSGGFWQLLPPEEVSS